MRDMARVILVCVNGEKLNLAIEQTYHCEQINPRSMHLVCLSFRRLKLGSMTLSLTSGRLDRSN
jgi:hypothetical protein